MQTRGVAHEGFLFEKASVAFLKTASHFSAAVISSAESE
jgi:hypothetical protein